MNVKRTFRRAACLLSRLLGNMGAGGPTPVLARFRSPVDAARLIQQWIDDQLRALQLTEQHARQLLAKRRLVQAKGIGLLDFFCGAAQTAVRETEPGVHGAYGANGAFTCYRAHAGARTCVGA